MRIAIIGQQTFGKSVFEIFLARGDEVAGVFCAPEKSGARPDPPRLAAEAANIRVLQLPSLKTSEAEQALRDMDVDLAVMAYVLQFAPRKRDRTGVTNSEAPAQPAAPTRRMRPPCSHSPCAAAARRCLADR